MEQVVKLGVFGTALREGLLRRSQSRFEGAATALASLFFTEKTASPGKTFGRTLSKEPEPEPYQTGPWLALELDNNDDGDSGSRKIVTINPIMLKKSPSKPTMLFKKFFLEAVVQKNDKHTTTVGQIGFNSATTAHLFSFVLAFGPL